jgi:hypothetical protein
MAIDIRATVTCSLGTLINGSISDDYIQGSGLVKTKGSVELSGIVTPALGTAVTFSYTKGGVTRSIPRKLRVLSSFADPFRRTTKVELGCKLTYLSDLQEPIDWTAFDDPANTGFTSADAEIVTVPIHAASVMDKCLTELGLTANSNPLTNKFSIEAFDFSAGYVSVLSDLLVSESNCAYLDANEVLQVFSLDQEGGTGPVIDNAKIIDLGSIGVGQLPGEAVTVSYSTLKLKQPDSNLGNGGADNGPLWETVEETNRRDVVITYTRTSDGTQSYRTYSVLDSTESTTTYKDFNIKTLVPGTGNIKIISGFEKIRKVERRQTIEGTGSVTIEGSLASNYLANGVTYSSSDVYKATTETFTYDEYGNETFYVSSTRGSLAHLVGNIGVQDWVFVSNIGLQAITPSRVTDREIARIERRTETIGEYQRVTTKTFGPWTDTIAGQQAMAMGLRGIAAYNDLNGALSSIFQQLYLLDTTVTTRRTSEGEVAPTGADVTNSASSDGGDPNNGYRTDSTAELDLALGSATAQRRIEFSMPYAPDDTFVKNAGPPVSFGAVDSDAPQKAAKYGRCQNRLLLGNRSGMNLQLAPETLPSAPFAPIVVQANGLSALYRVNGTNWQLSSDGVLVSTDALFWGAVGGTGAFWFPVAPGITTLPTTPPVISGSMTVTRLVPVWNETVVLTGTLRIGVGVQSLPYAMELLTPLTIAVRFNVTNLRVSSFTVSGVADSTIAALAPRFETSVGMRPPATDSTIEAPLPVVGREVGVYVGTTAIDMVIAAYAPAVPGSLQLRPPVANVAVAAPVPTVGRYVGVYADPPAANTAVAALAPTRA